MHITFSHLTIDYPRRRGHRGPRVPQYSYSAPSAESSEEAEVIPILRDDRVHEDDGTYTLDVEYRGKFL